MIFPDFLSWNRFAINLRVLIFGILFQKKIPPLMGGGWSIYDSVTFVKGYFFTIVAVILPP